MTCILSYNVSVMSCDLKVSHIGLVSVSGANVLVSGDEGIGLVSSFNITLFIQTPHRNCIGDYQLCGFSYATNYAVGLA